MMQAPMIEINGLTAASVSLTSVIREMSELPKV